MLPPSFSFKRRMTRGAHVRTTLQVLSGAVSEKDDLSGMLRGWVGGKMLAPPHVDGRDGQGNTLLLALSGVHSFACRCDKAVGWLSGWVVEWLGDWVVGWLSG